MKGLEQIRADEARLAKQRAVEQQLANERLARFVNRMYERGLITTREGADRVIKAGMPLDPHRRIGLYEALLSMALWPTSEEQEVAK